MPRPERGVGQVLLYTPLGGGSGSGLGSAPCFCADGRVCELLMRPPTTERPKTMNTCPKCQHAVNVGNEPCPNCGHVPSTAPPLPTSGPKQAFLTKARHGCNWLLGLAVATWRFVALKVRATKAAVLDLPPLYRQLGEHIEANDAVHDEFADHHRAIGELKQQLALLSGKRATSQAGTILERCRAILSAAGDKLRTIPLQRQLKRSRRRLGEIAVAKHGSDAGPAPLVSQIVETVSHVDDLVQQSRGLEERYAGRILTPSRTAVAGTMLVGLLVCGLVWRASSSSETEPAPTASASIGEVRGTASEPEQSPPAEKVMDPSQDALQASGKYGVFIQNDPFCRDVVNAMSLERFLKDNPDATLDNENSNADIGFQQYNESFFQYGFLDKKLVSITMLLPRDQNGIDQEFTKYHDAFGPPHDSNIPAQMKADGATRHAAWNLPDDDLAVSLTVQPSQTVGLVLVGFWRSVSRGDELRRRLDGLDRHSDERRGEDATSRTQEPEFGVGVTAGEVREFGEQGIKFCWCPAGTFKMGSPASDSGAKDSEKPQVDATLSRGFWLGQTEVAQALWERVMGTRPWTAFVELGYVREGAKYPAVGMGWSDAVEFCAKLSDGERRAGRLPTGWEYRLPTEAEWEYACRAGTKTRYSFGDDSSLLDDYAWWQSTSGYRSSHEVGLRKPNPWKLHDVHGNVKEWCSDIYDEKLRGGRDPSGASEGSGRVTRGGGWISGPVDCRSASRNWSLESGKSFDLGFRLALGIVPRPIQKSTATSGSDSDTLPGSRGLSRAGYTAGKCLLCFSDRNPESRAAYSDGQGFGLCDRCGKGVLLMRRAQQMQEAGVVPPSQVIRETRAFGAFVSTCFSRDDSDARRGLVLMILTKFGSPEWDVVTSGRE